MVSIHAPAWGATTAPAAKCPSFLRFQSTPPRGGRRETVRRLYRPSSRFNPRPRVGGDNSYAAWPWATKRCFNPRPRVGGDWRLAKRGERPDVCFNPRPRVGGDSFIPAAVTVACRFQSTPPRGGRLHEGQELIICNFCFNPRPRVGGDPVWPGRGFRGFRVSIHAPAWGATTKQPSTFCRFRMFQSTPPRGGRLVRRKILPPLGRCFNPRPRVGGDKKTTSPGIYGRVSIHAPAWGATRTSLVNLSIYRLFQSTPPRGGRRRP